MQRLIIDACATKFNRNIIVQCLKIDKEVIAEPKSFTKNSGETIELIRLESGLYDAIIPESM